MRTSLLAIPLFLSSLASAADLPVTYNVQDKPLKTAVAGTQLTFALYSDAACSSQVFTTNVNIENVSVASKLKLFVAKGTAVKPPATDQLQTTLTGVTPSQVMYLKVTGTGVTPAGVACQVQATSVTSAPGVVVKDANGRLLGTYMPPNADLNVSEGAFRSVGGQTVLLLFFQFAPFFADTSFDPVFFSQAGCTGQAMLRRVFTVSVEEVIGSMGYVPVGPYSPSTAYASYRLNGACIAISGADTLAPAATDDLSAFTPPFHVEMQ